MAGFSVSSLALIALMASCVFLVEARPKDLLENFGPGSHNDGDTDQAGVFRMVIGGPDGSEERTVTYKRGGGYGPPPTPAVKATKQQYKPRRPASSSEETRPAYVQPPTYISTKVVNKPAVVEVKAASESSEEASKKSYRKVKSYDEDSKEYPPAKYAFAYKVTAEGPDDSKSQEFGHSESRDGSRTDGKYYVELPDGRLQTVEYYVDGGSGFIAKVTYSGGKAADSAEKKPY